MANRTEPRYWTYQTAADSPVLKGFGVTLGQLKHAVHTGRLGFIRFGQRVYFTEDHLREWIKKSTVDAVR